MKVVATPTANGNRKNANRKKFARRVLLTVHTREQFRAKTMFHWEMGPMLHYRIHVTSRSTVLCEILYNPMETQCNTRYNETQQTEAY